MQRGRDLQQNEVLAEKLSRLDHLRKLQQKAEKIARKQRGNNVFKAIGFVPNEGPQSYFLNLPDANLDVLYGGAVGGGKAWRSWRTR